MVSATAIRDGVEFEPVNAICKRVIGKRVAPATLWRWIRKGNKGGRLEAVQINGCWHCTHDAFADFLNRQTEAALAAPSEPESASDDDLRAAGLL